MKQTDNEFLVYIFDDDKGDIKLLKSMLQKSNPDFEIIEAVNDEEISNLLRRGARIPAVIFLDIQIPGKGGMEWLKEINTLSIAPVIMLTGHGDELTAAESMKNGAFDYIPKDTLTKFELEKTIYNCRERWQIQKERDALLGIAAHELRNPLFAISGYIELLMDKESNIPAEEQWKIYDIIYQSSVHLNEIIRNILDYSSIDKGKIKIRFSKINLVLLIQAVVLNQKFLADSKNIKINFNSNEEECFCDIDRTRIEEVLSNLIDNAVKYSAPGTTVSVSLEKYKEEAVIHIKDEGQGIKEHELKFIFDMFSNVKISSRPTGGEKSTGLGLAICKKIVNMHKGNISVSSEPGKGSIFTVSLPFSQSNPASPLLP